MGEAISFNKIPSQFRPFVEAADTSKKGNNNKLLDTDAEAQGALRKCDNANYDNFKAYLESQHFQLDLDKNPFFRIDYANDQWKTYMSGADEDSEVGNHNGRLDTREEARLAAIFSIQDLNGCSDIARIFIEYLETKFPNLLKEGDPEFSHTEAAIIKDPTQLGWICHTSYSYLASALRSKKILIRTAAVQVMAKIAFDIRAKTDLAKSQNRFIPAQIPDYLIEPLIDNLTNDTEAGDKKAFEFAAEALTDIGEKTLPYLKKFLINPPKDCKPAYTAAAFIAVNSIIIDQTLKGNSNIDPEIMALAEKYFENTEQNGSISHFVGAALAEQGFPIILRAFNGTSIKAKESAVIALGSFSRLHGKENIPVEMADPLIEMLADENKIVDYTASSSAAYLLKSMGEKAIPALTRATSHTNPKIAAKAAEIKAKIESSKK